MLSPELTIVDGDRPACALRLCAQGIIHEKRCGEARFQAKCASDRWAGPLTLRKLAIHCCRAAALYFRIPYGWAPHAGDPSSSGRVYHNVPIHTVTPRDTVLGTSRADRRRHDPLLRAPLACSPPGARRPRKSRRHSLLGVRRRRRTAKFKFRKNVGHAICWPLAGWTISLFLEAIVGRH